MTRSMMQGWRWLMLVAAVGCGADDGFTKPADAPADDAPIDAAIDAMPDAPPDAPLDGPPLPNLSPQDMVATKCATGVCKASDVVAYWTANWDAFAIKRTVRFKETSATVFSMEVFDGNGVPSTLSFEAGRPVTLTIVNPGDTSSKGKHNFTTPQFYRAVAWRNAANDGVEYRAPNFDAIHVRRLTGTDRSMVLNFVPIVQGTYTGYCNTGVPNGSDYAAIVAGTVVPDLNATAGHAGLGMKTSLEVTGALGVTLDQQVDPTRNPLLDADPRRRATDPVWATAVRNETYRASPIQMIEYTIEEFAIAPANINLLNGIGSVLRVVTPISNLFSHRLSSEGLFISSVLREAQDERGEVEASYLNAAQIRPGSFVELFVVPTVDGAFADYCGIAVARNPDGTPNLATGHAKTGMLGTIRVMP